MSTEKKKKPLLAWTFPCSQRCECVTKCNRYEKGHPETRRRRSLTCYSYHLKRTAYEAHYSKQVNVEQLQFESNVRAELNTQQIHQEYQLVLRNRIGMRSNGGWRVYVSRFGFVCRPIRLRCILAR